MLSGSPAVRMPGEGWPAGLGRYRFYFCSAQDTGTLLQGARVCVRNPFCDCPIPLGTKTGSPAGSKAPPRAGAGGNPAPPSGQSGEDFSVGESPLQICQLRALRQDGADTLCCQTQKRAVPAGGPLAQQQRTRVTDAAPDCSRDILMALPKRFTPNQSCPHTAPSTVLSPAPPPPPHGRRDPWGPRTFPQ